MVRAKKLKIGVIFGGRSGEHEVSIVSAESVIKALDRKKYQIIPVGVAKDGTWLVKNPIQALKDGVRKGSRLIPENVLNKLDVIFPVTHGPFGEDGTLQGLLEMANVAYVGANVLGSALGMDKIIQKQLFKLVGLPIVNFLWFFSTEFKKNQKAIIKKIEKTLRYPIFVKPANLGSSVGISKTHNRQKLISAINSAAKFDRKIIVEQGIENILEIECSVLGNDNPQASKVGEIRASNEFYDYDAKYINGKSESTIPAKLPKSVAKKIRKIALAAFKTLDLCGLARVDFFVKKRSYEIYLSEVNTIPGFTAISMYPKLWQASGLSYPKLLDKLIQLAQEKWTEKNKLATSYRPKKKWYK